MKLDISKGEIKQVIIGEISLPLKKRLKLSEAEKLEECASFLEEYIDFSKISREIEDEIKETTFEWLDDELRSFLDETDSGKQKIFLRSIAEKPDRLTWDELKEIMKKEGKELASYSMAGLLSCFSRRAKHFGKKERFWESIWDDENEERFYRLKEPYRKIFADYFEV